MAWAPKSSTTTQGDEGLKWHFIKRLPPPALGATGRRAPRYDGDVDIARQDDIAHALA